MIGDYDIFSLLNEGNLKDKKLIKLLEEGHVNDIEPDAQVNPLLLSIQSGDRAMFDLILHYNPNINKEVYGVLPINQAAEQNNSYFVQKLVEHGANVYQRDTKGHNVFDIAKEYQSDDVLEYLNQLNKKTKSANIIKKHWNIHKEHQRYKPGGKEYYEAYSNFNKLRNSSF